MPNTPHSQIYFVDGHNIKVVETVEAITAAPANIGNPNMIAPFANGLTVHQDDGTVTWIQLRNVIRIESLS